MKLISIVVFLSFILSSVVGLRVLGVFPVNIRSHLRVFQSLMKELAFRGHDVTVVSHYPLEKPLPRYRDISLRGIFPLFVETVDVENLYNYNRLDMYIAPTELSQWAQGICESTYFSDRLKVLWNSTTRNYDLMLVEMFNTDCFLPLSSKFNIPVVAISSCQLLPWVSFRFGMPLNPSYIPSIFMGYPNKLDFLQRLENSVTTWIHVLYHRFWRNVRDDVIVRKYFNRSFAPVEEFARNVSVLLVNTHHTLHDSRPLPPNVVEIGGIHLPARKTLPKVKNLVQITLQLQL